MNKTLAGFFGIKEKVASAVVDAVVDSLTGDSAETKKETAAEGTTAPAEEIEPTVGTPSEAETVTGGDTDAPVEAAGGAPLVGEETLEETDPVLETEELTVGVIEGEEFETPPGVEMASLPAAELSQIQADAASWNAHKGEFAVLQNWYKNTTGAARVGVTADAADVAPEKKKSWEKAAWNN